MSKQQESYFEMLSSSVSVIQEHPRHETTQRFNQQFVLARYRVECIAWAIHSILIRMGL